MQQTTRTIQVRYSCTHGCTRVLFSHAHDHASSMLSLNASLILPATDSFLTGHAPAPDRRSSIVTISSRQSGSSTPTARHTMNPRTTMTAANSMRVLQAQPAATSAATTTTTADGQRCKHANDEVKNKKLPSLQRATSMQQQQQYRIARQQCNLQCK